MEFSMRFTGTLAGWCRKVGDEEGLTDQDFVRTCIRKELKRRGIDWKTEPGEAPATSPEPAAELADQPTLPPDLLQPFDPVAHFNDGTGALISSRPTREAILAGIGKAAPSDPDKDPFDE